VRMKGSKRVVCHVMLTHAAGAPQPALPLSAAAAAAAAPGVGKSCLLLRFSEDSFTPSFITTIG
jgi:hypothetical protein